MVKQHIHTSISRSDPREQNLGRPLNKIELSSTTQLALDFKFCDILFFKLF